MTAAAPTAKRPRGSGFRRLRRSELGLLAIPVLIGLVLPVLFSIRPAVAVTAVGVAVAAGFGSAFLARVARQLALWIIGLGGGLAWGVAEPALALSWLLLFPSALALGSHLRAGRGAPAEGLAATPPADRMVCDAEGEEELSAFPSELAALAAVEALDGARRTVVSLIRGGARLDVGGDADGAMMVYHCDDTGARRARWSHLTSADAADQEVVVRVAGTDGHVRRWQTTTIGPARQAVSAFVRSGGRVAGPDWRTDDEVADLRPPQLGRD